MPEMKCCHQRVNDLLGAAVERVTVGETGLHVGSVRLRLCRPCEQRMIVFMVLKIREGMKDE